MNLGTAGCKAVQALKANPDFRAFVDALHEKVREAMNAVLECEPAVRHDAAGMARGLRNLYVAVTAELEGQRQQAVKKPSPVERS